MADQRVREVQQWLNDTFPSYFKFSDDGSEMGIYPIEPDGITGSRTMKALVMAVQIHYNLTPVDGILGNGTSAACATISAGVTDSVILKIAQGGFYCKGYEAGGFDGIWGNGLATIISTFKEDLGIIGNSTMEPQVFKALLTTDPTVLVNSGDEQIRNVQKFLNRNYYSLYKAKLGYIPTGGIFERKTSKALIYAFQKEINTTADGALGPKTFESMPEIEEGCTNQNLVKILQACLICNGYATDFDGVYDTALAAKITEFQQFMCLNIDPTVMLGSVNRRTWGALLWSKGDTDRTPNACDCRTKIKEASTANALYANGFRYIGRYLTNVEPDGYDKRMTPEEVSILLDAGLKIFPIFQESASTPVPTDFTETQGKEDADRAINAAYRLGIEPGTTLYFAIDCDMMDDDITNYAIPYFIGIMTQFRLSKDYYSVGVYGARNTCTRLMSADLAERCFVSNMSTGYSGNLGYKMPEDWSFEQYVEKKAYTVGNMTFALDFDMASGNDAGIETVDSTDNLHEYEPPYIPTVEEIAQMKPISELIDSIRWLEEQYYLFYGVNAPTDSQKRDCQMAVCDYLYQYMYHEYLWEFISARDISFINYVNALDQKEIHIQTLRPYIYTVETGEGNEKIVDRADLVTDGTRGAFELPHLAVVIKCYIRSLAPGAWSAWAGDFATLVKEIYVHKQAMADEYVSYAMEALGKMEPDVANIHEVRMFNYCDLIADIDGYAIERLLERSDSAFGLSECIQLYYNTYDLYGKRYQYWKEILGVDSWSIPAIKNAAVTYYDNAIALKVFFSLKEILYPGVAEAAAQVLALNILYWAYVEEVTSA